MRARAHHSATDMNPSPTHTHRVEDRSDRSGPGRLLVIEDEAFTREILAGGLVNAGFDVAAVASGEEALSLAEARDFDLAIVDLALPGKSGVDTAVELAREYGIPFMVLSAQKSDEAVDNAIARGALGYLVKPVDPPQVVPAVRAALRRAQDFANLKETELRLRTALEDNQDVNVAIGILMGRHRIARDEAVERVRAQARRERRRMRDIAREFLEGKREV